MLEFGRMRGIRNRQNQIFSEYCGLSQVPSFMTEHLAVWFWKLALEKNTVTRSGYIAGSEERAEIHVRWPFDRSEWYIGRSIQKRYPSSFGMGCWQFNVANFPSAHSYFFHSPTAVDSKKVLDQSFHGTLRVWILGKLHFWQSLRKRQSAMEYR